MQLGIFAKTFEGSAPGPVLAKAAAAGFSCVQYNMACSGLPSMPDAVPQEIADSIRAAADENGLAIAALSGTYNMIHPNPDVRLEGHRRLEVLAQAAPSLPTRLITLSTGTRDADDMWRAHRDNQSKEAWRDLLESLETAVGIAERHDVDLGIEPELANVVNSAEMARRLINEVGSARLKIVFDPANLFEKVSAETQRSTVSAAVDLLADRIAIAHAKDRTAEGEFTTAGKGVLDYPHFLTKLGATGFGGPLVTHGLAAHEADSVSAFLVKTLRECGLAAAL
jgi:sugar phosphate isomerase/epimerase